MKVERWALSVAGELHRAIRHRNAMIDFVCIISRSCSSAQIYRFFFYFGVICTKNLLTLASPKLFC